MQSATVWSNMSNTQTNIFPQSDLSVSLRLIIMDRRLSQ